MVRVEGSQKHIFQLYLARTFVKEFTRKKNSAGCFVKKYYFKRVGTLIVATLRLRRRATEPNNVAYTTR